ncbi:hypothetical protein GCM10010082_13350 [Kushneria pakistanensis]|uniref:Uncharacterized protein n=1 Tax=Kushneria pakistanensis TaxID=1508770 RepID=A0ABQ3FFS3_9GAMM|nr:hypothetical protein [Kushneria pakistanensis]GHC22599.1 hypothetical protein GCM10010082_13350 [Kushneria pakistanensis]
MQKHTADKSRFHDVRNEILDIAMHLNAQESEKRRQRAAERALQARRGIEDHFESRRLARQCHEEDERLRHFG